MKFSFIEDGILHILYPFFRISVRVASIVVVKIR